MNVIINFVLYFLLFAVVHSFLATDFIKNKAQKQFNHKFRYYRIIYNILSIITFAPIVLQWIAYSASSPHVYSIPGWMYPFIILIRVLAIGLFIYAGMQIDILEFIGLKQNRGEGKRKLIEKGAYGIVRHPFYTGGIILLFTTLKMSQLDLVAILLISIYCIIGAFIEERRLLPTFGEDYRKYQKEVSMFVPVKWFKKKLNV